MTGASEAAGASAARWRTAFTDLLEVPVPIALAPMGGSAGGALAAAVSQGGGLGLVGAGDAVWIDRECALAAQLTTQVLQVSDLEGARRAVDLGADVLVAQGTESGGHSGPRGRGTLALVPLVVDLAGQTPVLAAGGIADGRGVAAALALGASGALIGTRFQATPEALVEGRIKQAILDGHGEDTERSRVLDLARGSSWPPDYDARTLGHPFLEAWRGREAQLADDRDAQRAYAAGVTSGELPSQPVWASQAIDLIHQLVPARELVTRLAGEAAAALARIDVPGRTAPG